MPSKFDKPDQVQAVTDAPLEGVIQEVIAELTPQQVRELRLPYDVPSASFKGPLSKRTSNGKTVVLVGKQPYFGPSGRTLKRRAARGRVGHTY